MIHPYWRAKPLKIIFDNDSDPVLDIETTNELLILGEVKIVDDLSWQNNN